MSSPITIFTYGHETKEGREQILADLCRSLPPLVDVLGTTQGQGTWEGVTEYCGTLLISGPDEATVVKAAARAAKQNQQDAIGVFHVPDGRTLIRPGSRWFHSAEELYAG